MRNLVHFAMKPDIFFTLKIEHFRADNFQNIFKDFPGNFYKVSSHFWVWIGIAFSLTPKWWKLVKNFSYFYEIHSKAMTDDKSLMFLQPSHVSLASVKYIKCYYLVYGESHSKNVWVIGRFWHSLSNDAIAKIERHDLDLDLLFEVQTFQMLISLKWWELAQ